MNEPLCGRDWFNKHKNDYTQAEIEALTITVSAPNGSKLTVPNRKEAKGIVKDLVKSKRERGRCAKD